MMEILWWGNMLIAQDIDRETSTRRYHIAKPPLTTQGGRI
jgi:hypothetical protein